MPRTKPLPKTETAICERLAAARKALRLSRVAFAQEAGIDSSQLSRYEHFRAPLKCGDALKICAAHGIGIPWLATGEGSVGYYSTLPEADVAKLDRNGPFSAAFSTVAAQPSSAINEVNLQSRRLIASLDQLIKSVGVIVAETAALPEKDRKENLELLQSPDLQEVFAKARELGAKLARETARREKLERAKKKQK